MYCLMSARSMKALSARRAACQSALPLSSTDRTQSRRRTDGTSEVGRRHDEAVLARLELVELRQESVDDLRALEPLSALGSAHEKKTKKATHSQCIRRLLARHGARPRRRQALDLVCAQEQGLALALLEESTRARRRTDKNDDKAALVVDHVGDLRKEPLHELARLGEPLAEERVRVDLNELARGVPARMRSSELA